MKMCRCLTSAVSTSTARCCIIREHCGKQSVYSIMGQSRRPCLVLCPPGKKTLTEPRCLNVKGLRDGKEVCRLVKSCLVGLSGVVFSVGSLRFLTDVAGLFYVISAILSHLFSVTNNFIRNQTWTFRDRSQGCRFSVVFGRWIRFQIHNRNSGRVVCGHADTVDRGFRRSLSCLRPLRLCCGNTAQLPHEQRLSVEALP
jgi:hypothetical protein